FTGPVACSGRFSARPQGFRPARRPRRAQETLALVTSGSDKRLVLRLLELWRRARRSDRLPHVTQLTPADAGTDAAQLFQIDVLSSTGARFTHIGSGLHLPEWPLKPAPLVVECPEESVLSLSSRHWREIVTRR